MTIQIVNGDLLEANEDILGHQVNCQGVMGSGIAKILRDRYPNLYPEYKNTVTLTRLTSCSDTASWCRRARSTRRICSASLTMEEAKSGIPIMLRWSKR